jgi:ADP-ribose pyrophosphatase YjhB (NUDIX family)
VKYRITVDLSKQKVIKPNNLEAGNMKKRVSLVIVFNNSDEVLLARRKHDPYKGEWSVPGGHVEKNESLLSAAIREIKEECNLTLSKNLKVLKLIILPDKEITFFTVRYAGNEKILAGSDVTEVGWFKLDEIPKLGWDEIPTIYVASKIV